MGIVPLGRVKKVKWVISSKKDSKWNKSGVCEGFISLSPRDADNWLKKCCKKYGKQPLDLTYEAKKL